MLPSNFSGSNIELGAPANMPADKVYDNIPAFFGIDENNCYIFITAWMPSKEDMDALKEGRPIFVKIYSNHMSPLSLFTQDNIGEINE